MNPENRAWIHRRAEELMPFNKNMRVLEVGSYIVAGQEDIQCRKTIPQLVDEFVGLDMRAGPGVDKVCDAKDMPEDWTDKFDVVICLDAFEHIDWPHKVMYEIGRVLKPGGLLYLATVFRFGIHDHPGDYWRFTPECIRMLIEEGGLEVLEYGGSGGHDPKFHPVVVKGIGKKPCES